MLKPLGLAPSFGFGDRLSLATPGHIEAVRGSGFAPIFAQQSVRENARTGRTPQQVLDDARRAVEQSGWEGDWGADADHLKTVGDLPPFVEAGYTFYTVDPGEYVDNTADHLPRAELGQKARELNYAELERLYVGREVAPGTGIIEPETLQRAVVKYGRAIQHTVELYRRLAKMLAEFDFEVSVDETDSPTTPLEHFYFASELLRQEVRFTSLAPRFIGRFEKGVDYVGDLTTLDTELARHAAVTAHFGTYKISLHSGSDKLSVYPLLAKHWGNRVHVKTAGTSYLEALRVFARCEPDLFQRIYAFARQHYEADRRTYHVSAELARLPLTADLPALLDDFHAREVLHVTFGSVLAQFGPEFRLALERHLEAYHAGLRLHFARHLEALRPGG